MSGFDDYADAVIEQQEDFLFSVAAGEVEHRHPLTREQAAEEALLQVEQNRRLADLFDNDNPDSLWYS